MVLIRCISRSQRLKLDFRDENYKKSSCLKLQCLEPHLVHVYQVCSNYAPGVKMGPLWGSHILRRLI